MEKPFYSDSEGESGPTESADSGTFQGDAGSIVSTTDVFVTVNVKTGTMSFKAVVPKPFLLPPQSPCQLDVATTPPT